MTVGLAEAGVAALVHWLRRSCPWLIVSADLRPHLDSKGLERFLEHGWDSQLGWIRKPDTAHDEIGRDGEPTRYHIDRTGARRDPDFDGQAPSILAYGDSYTFCRQVNDDGTWPHFLGRALGRRVDNRGVGNYGLDQALLRLEREYADHPTPIVIIGVVPETISRIVAVWKHFSEYGNIFAFKPCFRLNSGKLDLLENPAADPKQFYAIAEMMPALQQNDYFYARKFAKDILRFPFLWHLCRNWRRNLPLLIAAFRDRILGGDRAFCQVMDRNIDIAAGLYRDQAVLDLAVALVARFAEFCRVRNARPVFVMIPQLSDLGHMAKGDRYYLPLLESVRTFVTVVDMGDDLMRANDPRNYINDRFGGHLSVQGNRLVAQALRVALEDLVSPAASTIAGAAAMSGAGGTK